ncbi:molybdopterin-guanine dinucleotide biosynthesis protein B [Methanococcus vannielii SB]|jgi:molybdopterin-guanine dinucleotide biosynthesis protein B|uniref:Molybdopterin-guanine dinucleotide biosynthesis protein B n=1 Tax=Methanococcus vannielii (strain ATCC 35089 / DSM 1224 / JCM 13029 / OCM 148 / SB) TaxID=406327 RepID=A6UQ86_METVS|nr:molybdopterin-guanine dinucleotide biosynthesis protein MobB [Methanococcus vannielii]ABR54658.1 molybdopterin-guanine dinucleotide biosynthesis protein B [Methanococcus vannielii SB]
MTRVIGVIGRKDTGKTNLIADILKNLKSENLSFATVKNSHMDIEVDVLGTDSHNLKKLSEVSVFVTKKGSAFYYDNMNLKNILAKIDCDILIVEGFKEELIELNIPKILVTRDGKGTELEDLQTVMRVDDFKYDIDEVKNKVLEKAVVPTYNLNCGYCGHNCKIFTEKVVAGVIKWDSCVMATGLKLVVDGKTIPLNPFVSEIIQNTLKGMIGTLKCAKNPKNISIKIEKK